MNAYKPLFPPYVSMPVNDDAEEHYRQRVEYVAAQRATKKNAPSSDSCGTASEVTRLVELVSASEFEQLALCGGADPKKALQKKAREILKQGQRTGVFPAIFPALVWLSPVFKIILLVLEHWLANGGQWTPRTAEGEAAWNGQR